MFKNLIRKYFSIFTLAVFLFSLLAVNIHVFSHHDEAKCLSSQKHIHEKEHNCSLSDYNNNPQADDEPETQTVQTPWRTFIFTIFFNLFISKESSEKSSPRAPPIQ